MKATFLHQVGYGGNDGDNENAWGRLEIREKLGPRSFHELERSYKHGSMTRRAYGYMLEE